MTNPFSRDLFFFFFLISILTELLSGPCMFSQTRGEPHQELCTRTSEKRGVPTPALLGPMESGVSATLGQ